MTRAAIQEQIAPERVLPQPVSMTVPGLVTLNTRVEPAINEALMRASMERRLQRLPKSKIQDMVGEALAEWLKNRDYLK